MGRENLQSLDARIENMNLVEMRFFFSLSSPKGRRGPGRGGSLSSSAPLSCSLPTRALAGREREAKDPTLILGFMGRPRI